VIGLAPGTTYYVEIFAYKGSGAGDASNSGINYQQTSPLAGNQATESCIADAVTFVQQTNYYEFWGSGGYVFQGGATNVGMWANSGAEQTAAWRLFRTDGSGGGDARELQVGDRFRITVFGTGPGPTAPTIPAGISRFRGAWATICS
jgi:hypothetical protein